MLENASCEHIFDFAIFFSFVVSVFPFTFMHSSQNLRAPSESEVWRTAGCQKDPADSRHWRHRRRGGAKVTISRQRYRGDLMGLTQGAVNLRRAGGELNMIWGLQPRGAESEQPCDDPPQCFRHKKTGWERLAARFNSLNILIKGLVCPAEKVDCGLISCIFSRLGHYAPMTSWWSLSFPWPPPPPTWLEEEERMVPRFMNQQWTD